MDTTLLQTVAIKEYFPFGAVRRNDRNEIELYDEKYRKDYEKGLESFLCEGRILARFSNLTAVVGVKNFFHENNTAYLVMDYVEGLSVREYVKNYGVLSPDRTLFLVQQVIADMQMIHHKQVLHRDVSADNLIITHNGSLKLIDFGATRHLRKINIPERFFVSRDILRSNNTVPVEIRALGRISTDFVPPFILC